MRQGHDGTWVAHPALVGVAREAFSALPGGGTNQLGASREGVSIGQGDLLRAHSGPRTEAGARACVRVGDGVYCGVAWGTRSGAVV